ncbi:Hypothetical protein ETEE_0990 [Edwardsiella anguillarum ET080813]|uniref:Uncharacterized protein n=1 Tax=Edwardsiella anguillarum ET080813 TaxID=667120 RepID=A0A076LG05_9GAMM|nr:Hypothetical protein ETEE_0990 [Edwardsiella anguillarum ET080813]
MIANGFSHQMKRAIHITSGPISASVIVMLITFAASNFDFTYKQ